MEKKLKSIWCLPEQEIRMNKFKIHPRQPMNEVLELILSEYEKNNGD